jgi:hypothetical protein
MTSSLFDPLEAGTGPPSVEAIVNVFNDFDGSGSGLLAPRQALAACQAVPNIGFSKPELESYVKEGLDVAGDGNGRIKLAPFASYLAFEAAKRFRSVSSNSNQSPPQGDTNPFLDMFDDPPQNTPNISINSNSTAVKNMKVAITPDASGLPGTTALTNSNSNTMQNSYSPTVATDIPDWFGHSIQSIETGNYPTPKDDPFAIFGLDDNAQQNNPGHATSFSLTIPAENEVHPLPTFKPASSAQLPYADKNIGHMSFPTQDILFDDDNNYNSNSGVSIQPNISPKHARKRPNQGSQGSQVSQGLIAPPRAKGDKVPKHKAKSSRHQSRNTPVADFTFADNFATIAEQAQRSIEADVARHSSEESSDSGHTPRVSDQPVEKRPPETVPKEKEKSKKRPKIDAIVQMKKGSAMLKYGRHGFPHFRRFQITDDLTKLIWFSRKKSLSETHVRVRDMRDILQGQQTDVFKQCTQRTLEKASFSIIYGSKLKTLDVVAKSAEEGQLWVKGLKGLIKANKQGKLHKVIQILVDVNFKDITKTNYRECTDEQRRKNESKYQSRPELVHTIGTTLDQSEKIFQNLTKAAENQNVKNSVEYENVSLMIREIEDRLQEISYGLTHKTAELSDLKRDVWVLKVDVTVMEEKVKVLSKIKKRRPI